MALRLCEKKRGSLSYLLWSRKMPFHPLSSYCLKGHHWRFFHSHWSVCPSPREWQPLTPSLSLEGWDQGLNARLSLGFATCFSFWEVQTERLPLWRTKAFPPSIPAALGAQGCRSKERSKALCRWPCLADWKSSLWMSQEGNCLLSLFPLKKHSYTHR